MVDVLVKVHEAGVLSLCDSNLIGKKFEENDIILNISERFYNGHAVADNDIIELIKEADNICIVGKKAVDLAKKSGVVKEEGVKIVKGIPFAMVFSVE